MNQNKDATSWKHHEKKLSKITNEKSKDLGSVQKIAINLSTLKK